MASVIKGKINNNHVCGNPVLGEGRYWDTKRPGSCQVAVGSLSVGKLAGAADWDRTLPALYVTRMQYQCV